LVAQLVVKILSILGVLFVQRNVMKIIFFPLY